jgi:hypothetical protein
MHHSLAYLCTIQIIDELCFFSKLLISNIAYIFNGSPPYIICLLKFFLFLILKDGTWRGDAFNKKVQQKQLSIRVIFEYWVEIEI